MLKKNFLYIIFLLLCLSKVTGQEESPFVSYDVPSQNLLKFNRFLINPTFSTVREDKSYINLLHRNQSVSFDDNNQDYFLSYSGRVNDRSGLGLSLYTQREGLISNYGVMANYAYGIKLSEKSNFTFGANLAYYNSGFDRNRANALDPNDPALNGLQDSNLLSFQPGFNISFGKFDFGIFAENLFDYNLKTSETITEFGDKTFSGHLQYTHQFENGAGILEAGRLMPLARVRKIGNEEVVFGGSLILDLPKLGWLQGGYDSFYGASAGIGFNINRRLSLGYTMEKGLSNNFDNFGLTHEISFAYSITPTLTEDRVMLEEGYEELAENEEEQEDTLTAQELEIEKLKKALAENDAILAELMFRQDSTENNRQKDLERRFEMVMKMVREETQGKRPDIEEKAKKMYLVNNENGALANNSKANPKENKPNVINSATTPKDAIATRKVETKITPKATKGKTEQDEFTRVAQQNNIKSKKFRNLDGVADGYYVVANVYKGETYLNKFVTELANNGIRADYFENPNNGLKYVYLERYDTWQEALAAHKSNINGTYSKDMWIMNVDNTRYSDADKAYVDNVNKIKEKSTQYALDKLQKNVVVKDNVTSNDPTAKVYKINGLGTGYYIIANVFANANNANRFVKMLNAQGLSASYFINPENNYRYVYLKRHESWNNALVSYYSRINDTYTDKMWIMRVTPNQMT
ncbi:type IX secretion system membrane protein PorP/SprF [Arenibacter sp. ARW7G5Y1]|uniref:PorP/SprF family type IX secretion system membrane protein n=1 Tax=Arenibacter sp. ARW7G5Y1 TaxID=2135619 RepID=UPI000D774FAA|nr:type IX secretion system membrane protein PorP/SprF [Arenibacter sp. ARW7G5Y1]PXX27854.1 type IX secretion system PorP/SprF family membrane protein [Arenibacter sp. ARW7G5Y1]